MPDSKLKIYLGITFVLALVVCGALVISYRQKTLTTGPAPTPRTSPAPTIPPEIEKEIAKVKEEGGIIPFDYQVISVSSSEIKVTGLKGEMTLSSSPTNKFFIKEGTTSTEAKFSDVKVGQKLTIERLAPPQKGLNIYIVGE